MTDDLDKKLRQALRPVDPGEDFTARVLAAEAARRGGGVNAERVGSSGSDASGRGGGEMSAGPRRRVWPLVGSVAATLVIAGIVTHQWWQERRERAGEEAREQVLEALRVTSEKLDLAYQIVNNS